MHLNDFHWREIELFEAWIHMKFIKILWIFFLLLLEHWLFIPATRSIGDLSILTQIKGSANRSRSLFTKFWSQRDTLLHTFSSDLNVFHYKQDWDVIIIITGTTTQSTLLWRFEVTATKCSQVVRNWYPLTVYQLLQKLGFKYEHRGMRYYVDEHEKACNNWVLKLWRWYPQVDSDPNFNGWRVRDTKIIS